MQHPLSQIHPEAVIAPDVEIGPFVFIDKNVEIGAGTKIASNVTILEGTRIGEKCNIFSGAVLGGIPQDLKFRGEESLAIIGNNTTIRECVTVNRGTAAKGKTVVGDNCLLMAYSHVAHDCIVANNVIIANASQLAGEVEIDDYAILGGGTLIHQFCKIGAHVMIQGGSKISKDIPPYVIAAREPASYAGVNSIGLKRRGFTNEQINLIQDVYRILFQSKLNTSNAIVKVLETIPETSERELIINFIKSSDRGIIKGFI
ncbi:MAG: acyl-ACP--UDP-N-acetylglucosamine O-acyltransferase [Paludibacter sp.]|nr:acyl-ACP--UDP-N-acetylglucosamine O-acyltransferase [Paludibacter sp.]MDD4198617.1 acyl-ACP--UDP-N-acetylglucosamine O-acyltransferase [Paludibacter sp.]MDD4427918.1 acyl-ACP--UDP-N-acetylglucosamine O-acyltransferase [Paludibacter sp.]